MVFTGILPPTSALFGFLNAVQKHVENAGNSPLMWPQIAEYWAADSLGTTTIILLPFLRCLFVPHFFPRRYRGGLQFVCAISELFGSSDVSSCQ